MFTEERMLEIIENDPVMLKVWAEDYPEIIPTQRVYDLAVQEEPQLLRFVPPEFQHEEMCIEAVKRDYRTLGFVHDQTMRVINEAFAEFNFAKYGHMLDSEKSNRYRVSIFYSPLSLLHEKTKENLLCALSHDGNLIADIHGPILDDDLREVAIRQDPTAFGSMDRGYPHESERIAVVALECGVEMWEIKHPQTPAICQAAVKANPEAIKYVKDLSMLEEGPKM